MIGRAKVPALDYRGATNFGEASAVLRGLPKATR
jgi:hypothetical protein